MEDSAAAVSDHYKNAVADSQSGGPVLRHWLGELADDGAGGARAGALDPVAAVHRGVPGDGDSGDARVHEAYSAEPHRAGDRVRDVDGSAGDFAGIVFEFSRRGRESAAADVGIIGQRRRGGPEPGEGVLVDAAVSVSAAGDHAAELEFSGRWIAGCV